MQLLGLLEWVAPVELDELVEDELSELDEFPELDELPDDPDDPLARATLNVVKAGAA